MCFKVVNKKKRILSRDIKSLTNLLLVSKANVIKIKLHKMCFQLQLYLSFDLLIFKNVSKLFKRQGVVLPYQRSW